MLNEPIENSYTNEEYTKITKQYKEITMPEQKKIVKLSPAGLAMYPFLTIPDTKFNPEGTYRIDLKLDPATPDHKEFLNQLHAHTPKGKDQTTYPFKDELTMETKEKTGKIIVHFSSRFKPNTFDSKGKELPENILVGNDSVVKIAYIENEYFDIAGRTGLNLYLQAVQVIELNEYFGKTAESYGFKEEDGYETKTDNPFSEETAKKADEIKENVQTPTEENEDPDSKLPF